MVLGSPIYFFSADPSPRVQVTWTLVGSLASPRRPVLSMHGCSPSTSRYSVQCGGSYLPLTIAFIHTPALGFTNALSMASPLSACPHPFHPTLFSPSPLNTLLGGRWLSPLECMYTKSNKVLRDLFSVKMLLLKGIAVSMCGRYWEQILTHASS